MKKSILSLATLVFASQVMLAQSRMVSGRVVDEKGEAVIGASVTTSDNKVTTFTDGEGNFTIEIPSGTSANLTIDNMGAKENINASGKDDLGTIKLGQTAQQLTGVVVTGYRNVSKERYNGAADKIDAKAIEKFPISNITRAIEGAAPGVQVTTASGQPGASAGVRVRGFGSISASSEPLYVVDGAPFSGDINSINPNDIESVNILKDAVATSMYGSRGANGVVVMTTKRGRNVNSKPVMTFNISHGIINRAYPDYDYMRNADEYLETAVQSYANSIMRSSGLSREDAIKVAIGLASIGGNKKIFENLGNYNPYNMPSTELFDSVTGKINPNARLRYSDDWMKLTNRQGSQTQVNAAVSGNVNDGKTDYYLSLGYTNEKGFLIRSQFERFSGLAKINTKVNNWLSMGLSANLSQQTNGFTWASSANSGNPMFVGRSLAPIFPVYFYDSAGNKQIDPVTGIDKYDWGTLSSDNEYEKQSSIGDRPGAPGNIVGSTLLDYDKYSTFNVNLIPYVNINITDEITFNTLFNYQNRILQGTYAQNQYYGTSTKGSVEKYNSFSPTYTFRQQLNYRKTFKDKHSIDALIAHENYKYDLEYVDSRANGLPFSGYTNTYGTNTMLPGNSRNDYHRIEGYLASVQYDYDGWYGLEASFRRDGSSRFAPESRWGNFWAIGGSVNMKRFDFLKDVKLIDRWRLKASYGTQGNEGFGSFYVWQTLYDFKTVDGITYVSPATLGNRNLTWEKQKQLNIGTEISLFNNRVNLDVNYFNRYNADLLTNLPIPGSTGFSSFPINALTMVNKGIEVSANFDVVRTEKVRWNTVINATHFTNKILKMHPQQDTIISGNQIRTVGSSIFDFYLVKFDGVVNYDNLATAGYGDSMNLGSPIYLKRIMSGDDSGKVVQTLNYDSAQRSNRIIAGNSLPKLQGSWNNTLTVGAFDFGVLMTYGIGGLAYDGIYADLMGPGSWGSNFHRDIKGAWSPENPTSNIPRTQMNEQLNIDRPSTRFLIDASYLNIRNISLGYTLPEKWSNKARLSSVRLYSQVDNVWMFSKRQGFNPMQSFSGDLGADSYVYSPNRTIVFGVRFNLQ